MREDRVCLDVAIVLLHPDRKGRHPKGKATMRRGVKATLALYALWIIFPAGVTVGHAEENAVLREPLRITITKVDCRRLVRHMPSGDVAYRPGVDVKGREVAPADLPGSAGPAMANLLPDVLEIPLNVKPLQGKAYATHGLDDTNMNLGTISYDMVRGDFMLNGQPLGSDDQAALAEACARRGVR